MGPEKLSLLLLSLFVFQGFVLWLVYECRKLDNETTISSPRIHHNAYFKTDPNYETLKANLACIYDLYGPLNQSDENQVAGRHTIRPSLKYPEDEYERLARHNVVSDDYYGVIGTADDCWLKLRPRKNIKPYHAQIVRDRGRYYLVELEDVPLDKVQKLKWHEYPYQHIKRGHFVLHDIDIFLNNYVAPILLSGKGIDGRIVSDYTEWKIEYGQTIGSSPECWVTLPDSRLPPFMAVRKGLGHHIVLFKLKLKTGGEDEDEFPYEEEYWRRVDKGPIKIAGYKIEIGATV